MDFDLAGRSCVVVGGSSGIGLASAQILIAEGVDILVVGRSSSRLEAAVAACGQGPGRLEPLALDVTADSAAAAVLTAIDEHFGKVTDLIYSAGMTSVRAIEELTDEEWREQWEINVMAPKRLIQALAPRIASTGGGAIVNVCSSSGRRPSATNAAYAVTKRAQLALTQVCAQRFGPEGVRVSAVAPGPAGTPLWLDPGGQLDQVAAAEETTREDALRALGARLPLGRLARAEEVAAVVVAALAPRMGVNGTTWSVDGGHVPDVFP